MDINALKVFILYKLLMSFRITLKKEIHVETVIEYQRFRKRNLIHYFDLI